MRPRPVRAAVTRTAWLLCGLSVAVGVVSVALASVNGISPWQLVVDHSAIGTACALSFPFIGALIVVRQPRNRYGWLLLVYGIVCSAFNLAQQYALLALGMGVEGLFLPGGTPASWLAAWTNMPGIALGTTLFVLLFPDGRVPSPRWRPVFWAAVAVTVLPAGVQAALTWPLRGVELARDGFVATDETTEAVFFTGLGLAVFLLIWCVVAQVLRFRRARGLQRLQLKWFAYGGLLSLPLNFAAQFGAVGAVLELLQVPVLFAAIAIAMFRYRLYDIDRIINRTLVYGLLTAILGGVYAVGVLGIGQAFTADREPSGLVVAAATLAVAAVFQPLRRGIQRAVDRRFNRRRYDAERTIGSFSARLRQQTDLDTLTAELLSVVDQTMEPTHASLWLRPTSHPTARGAMPR